MKDNFEFKVVSMPEAVFIDDAPNQIDFDAVLSRLAHRAKLSDK